MDSEGRTGRVLRPLIVGAMVACVAVATADQVARLGLALSTASLAVIPVVAALESGSTRRMIKARSLWRLGVVRTRLVEFAVLFIMVRFVSYLGYRWADVVADIRSWPSNSLAIVGPEAVVGFGIAVLSWWATNATEDDLERIGRPPRVNRLGRSLGRTSPRVAVAGRVFGGGALLLTITGLPYAGLGIDRGLDSGGAPGPALYLAAYFLLGLTLLAQVQHAVLQNRWKSHGVRVSLGLAERWARYSLAVLALATMVALVLPTGYSVGLFELLARAAYPLVVAATYVVYWLVVAVFFVIVSLGSLISLLFGSATAPIEMQVGDPPVVEPVGPAPAWLDVLRSLAFWAVLLSAVVYVVRSYLRDHPGALRALLRMGLVRGLLHALAALRRQAARVGGGARRLVSRGGPRRRRRGSRAERRFRFLRPGALPPRERIWYYYGSLLQRAARSGLPRGGSQTPFEYEATVRPALTEARDDLRLLTRAFVEARYSAHSIAQEQAHEAHAQLRRLTAALRSATKTREAVYRR